jgi:hypothetical protein
MADRAVMILGDPANAFPGRRINLGATRTAEVLFHLQDERQVSLHHGTRSPIEPKRRSDDSDCLILAAGQDRLDVFNFLVVGLAGDEIEVWGEFRQRQRR